MQFLVPSKFNPNPTALAVQNAWCSKVLNPTEQQGRQESNPQPPVLETGALPIELHPFMTSRGQLTRDRRYCKSIGSKADYSMILVTTPDPTVLPPSRIANRTPSSIATVFCSSTMTRTLSPGMHISAPTNSADPVTSVVRK